MIAGTDETFQGRNLHLPKPASFRGATLVALSALIAASAPSARALPPIAPDAKPTAAACEALGFQAPAETGRAYYGRGAMMAAPVGAPPPPPAAADALVVTAQKRSERIQDVPITISGFVAQPERDTERYPDATPNPVKQVAAEPVSTFSIDVDTAAYANVRRFLKAGDLPPSDAVRVEELVNYFDYGYAPPPKGGDPFAAHAAIVPSPWSNERQVLHIGLQGYDIPAAEQPPLNLVFLVDTSGSMWSEDRLPLAKKALDLLIGQLGPRDRVAMVAYAGSAGAVLAPTGGDQKLKMRCALEALRSGGSTAGGAGLSLAYALAEQNFDKGAVNRVILLTDGDFNVGVTSEEKLEDFVARKRKTGVYLSVYGFGRGNYNDTMMQTLSQAGNGVAAYIDTLDEARKLLRDDFSGSLFPIADDVKVQVEFNPALVSEYRLIGYETRMLAREDFNNDQVDAGEVGSGASVTALYEITPVGASASVDPLRYGEAAERPAPRPGPNAEYAYVKVRYKAPGGETSKLMSRPVTQKDVSDLADAPESTRWALAVAAFGQKLRGDPWVSKDYGWDEVERLAQGARGVDEFGLRAEFVGLVRAAKDARGVNE